MTPEECDRVFDQARHVGVELGPIGATPRRWLRTLRSDTQSLPELPAQPWAIVRSLAKRRPGGFILAVILSVLGAVSSTLVPWAMGRVVDAGIAGGFDQAFLVSALVFVGLVVLVALADSLNQLAEVTLWLTGAVGGRKLVGRHAATRARALKATHTSGDVVTASSSDAAEVGEFYTDFPEMIAAASSIAVASYIMLTTSLNLGLTILIGVPIVMGGLALLGKPLEKRQEAVREAQGELATIASDAVQGLRILRGIGGEDAYADSYERTSDELRVRASQAARAASFLYAARVGAPMLLITIVVAQGAFLTLNGELSVGQLLAFYGFTMYLRYPLWIWARLIEHFANVKVGARRLAGIIATAPLVSDAEAAAAPHAIDWPRAELTTQADGVHYMLQPGKLTVLTCDDTEKAGRIARAFARVSDPSALTVNGIPAKQIPLDELRANIVLSEATPHLFAGTLREDLLADQSDMPMPRGVTQTVWEHQIEVESTEEYGQITERSHPRDEELHQALAWAHAHDAVDSLRGLDGRLAEKGRNISGGQRQRLALARAYATNAPVLVLVEPTSALDSHTEALIVRDLPAARQGKTTLVITHSPLLAAHADVVIDVPHETSQDARHESSQDVRHESDGKERP